MSQSVSATSVRCMQSTWNLSNPNTLLQSIFTYEMQCISLQISWHNGYSNFWLSSMCLVSIPYIPRNAIDLRIRIAWVRLEEVHFVQRNLNHFQFTFLTIALTEKSGETSENPEYSSRINVHTVFPSISTYPACLCHYYIQALSTTLFPGNFISIISEFRSTICARH